MSYEYTTALGSLPSFRLPRQNLTGGIGQPQQRIVAPMPVIPQTVAQATQRVVAPMPAIPGAESETFEPAPQTRAGAESETFEPGPQQAPASPAASMATAVAMAAQNTATYLRQKQIRQNMLSRLGRATAVPGDPCTPPAGGIVRKLYARIPRTAAELQSQQSAMAPVLRSGCLTKGRMYDLQNMELCCPKNAQVGPPVLPLDTVIRSAVTTTTKPTSIVAPAATMSVPAKATVLTVAPPPIAIAPDEMEPAVPPPAKPPVPTPPVLIAPDEMEPTAPPVIPSVPAPRPPSVVVQPPAVRPTIVTPAPVFTPTAPAASPFVAPEFEPTISITENGDDVAVEQKKYFGLTPLQLAIGGVIGAGAIYMLFIRK